MCLKIVSVARLLVCLAFLYAVPSVRAEGVEDERLNKVLARNISFDFVATPLKDVLKFIATLAEVPVLFDPRVVEAGKDKTPISFRVANMELKTALKMIAKLAELDLQYKNGAIFFAPLDAKAPEKNDRQADNADDNRGMLRVRFANGDVVEADVTLLRKLPALAAELFSLAYDPANDKILVLAPGKDFPGSIGVESLIASAKQLAPDARIDLDQKLNLILIRAPDADLRRINAVARALRRAPLPGNQAVESGVQKERVMRERLMEAQRAEMDAAVERKKAAIDEDMARLALEAKRRAELNNNADPAIVRPVRPRRPPKDGGNTELKDKVTDQF